MSQPHQVTEILLTKDGPVRGFISNGMRQWLGIPYAAPPVGHLRWRPPVPPKPWTEPLLSTEYGPICAQEEGAFPGFGTNSLSEDCLYLNVYAPAAATAGKKLPVMVWIHGGGLFQGASNHYDPQWLVQQGNIVFVSLNYRVNLFGFFSHPLITAEGHASGNYGIMDQQEALRWVHLNIDQFGGDAENVTVFGESAGGISVSAHLSSPSSANLFHKAIIQSGGSPITMEHLAIEDYEETGAALVKEAGFTGNSAKELRELSAASLLGANSAPRGSFGTTRYPMALMEDGQVVPRDLRRKFLNGEFNRVPLIIGVTKDEFAWFQAMIELSTKSLISDDAYPAALNAFLAMATKIRFLGVQLPAEAFEEILERYPSSRYPNPARAVAAAIGDAGIISTAGRRPARVIKKFVTDVYVYEFAVDDSPFSWPDVSFPYGACHAQELQFLFRQFHGACGTPNPLSESQAKISEQMVRYWTNFAQTGSPSRNSKGQVESAKWEVYEADRDNAMLLQTPQVEMVCDWGARHHMEFWDSFYI